MADNLHKGHRVRLRKRYLETGLKGFADVNILEFLLTYPIARGDTNPLAHRLLQEGKTLKGVLDMPHDQLIAIDGIGEHTAIFLELLQDVVKTYRLQERDQESVVIILDTVEKCGHYITPHFMGYREEAVFLLCLDAACKPLDCRELSRGSVNSANISVRKVVELALSKNATTVVLAHNHTSGIALPSVEDEQTTHLMRAALDAVGIPLVDHIIVSGSDFVSMAQSGFFDRIPPKRGDFYGI